MAALNCDHCKEYIEKWQPNNIYSTYIVWCRGCCIKDCSLLKKAIPGFSWTSESIQKCNSVIYLYWSDSKYGQYYSIVKNIPRANRIRRLICLKGKI